MHKRSTRQDAVCFCLFRLFYDADLGAETMSLAVKKEISCPVIWISRMTLRFWSKIIKKEEIKTNIIRFGS